MEQVLANGFDWDFIKPEYQNKSLYRGERNNNPFNMDQTPDDWQGELTNPTDTRFMQFRSPVYGIRAGIVLLINYQRKYKLDTVRKIVTRFAPPNENKTEAYIAFVCRETGLKENEVFDVRNVARKIAIAFIKQENMARCIYTDICLDAAVAMALGTKLPVPVTDADLASKPQDFLPYIGAQFIFARRMVKDGQPGYEIQYADGYKGWSPKDVFEKIYLGLVNQDIGVTPCEIANLIKNVDGVRHDTVMTAFIELCTGYAFGVSAPYSVRSEKDEPDAMEDAKHLAEYKLREMIEFVLDWARNGIN